MLRKASRQYDAQWKKISGWLTFCLCGGSTDVVHLLCLWCGRLPRLRNLLALRPSGAIEGRCGAVLAPPLAWVEPSVIPRTFLMTKQAMAPAASNVNAVFAGTRLITVSAVIASITKWPNSMAHVIGMPAPLPDIWLIFCRELLSVFAVSVRLCLPTASSRSSYQPIWISDENACRCRGIFISCSTVPSWMLVEQALTGAEQ
jgi:hypothetical protein